MPPTNALRRGFTGHEHDEGGLVNAKGRIYDPTIAQFLQTDPVIGDAVNAQTYHPYSYVYNRPFVFTHPSGFLRRKAALTSAIPPFRVGNALSAAATPPPTLARASSAAVRAP